MNDSKQKIFLTTLICSVYLLLTICYHHIDKYLSGVLFFILTLLIPITFIIVVIYEVKGFIDVFRNRQNITSTKLVPILICTLTLAYALLVPYRYKLDSEKLESEVDFRACYEGTQNQAYIKFRKDRSFELNSTGVFFSDNWWTGQWTKQGDTIFLKYNKNQIAKALGSKILIKNGYLNSIDIQTNAGNLHRPMFYLGYCKHEN